MTGLKHWQAWHPSPHPEVNRGPLASDSSDIYRGRTQSPAMGTLGPDDGLAGPSLLDMLGRGRLGALAEKVELAITRWARRNSSARSASSSSSAPSRRRNRHLSVGSFPTVQSERDIAARIKWIKAREEQRHIPRGFTLYVPSSSNSAGRPHEPMMRPVTRTTSLSLILNQLELTFKPTPKSRHAQRQNHDDYMFVGGAVISAEFPFFPKPTNCMKQKLEMSCAQEFGTGQRQSDQSRVNRKLGFWMLPRRHGKICKRLAR